jgi:hypothetical protein
MMRIFCFYLLFFIVFCGNLGSKADLTPADYKPVLVGRKDLIRNAAIDSNNKVFKEVINNQNLALQSLNKQLFILLDENQELKREIQTLKNKK